jgi:hypothetical protein
MIESRKFGKGLILGKIVDYQVGKKGQRRDFDHSPAHQHAQLKKLVSKRAMAELKKAVNSKIK